MMMFFPKRASGPAGQRVDWQAFSFQLSAFNCQPSRPLAISPSRRRAGFTLIEMLVYLAIVGVVLLAITSLSFEFVKSRSKSLALDEVSRNGRLAMSRMIAEIQEAQAIEATTTFGSNPGMLALQVTGAGLSPTIFAVSGGQLTVRQGGGPVLPLTTSQVVIDNFTLTDLSSSTRKTQTIAIHLELSYRTTDTDFTAHTTLDTTAQVKKADGFAN